MGRVQGDQTSGRNGNGRRGHFGQVGNIGFVGQVYGVVRRGLIGGRATRT